LEEASNAKAEAGKPQEVAKNVTTLRQLKEEELRRTSEMLEKAKIESCMFQWQL
jgi:hypothetical protein